MKKVYLLFFALLFSSLVMAQNPSKGFKALENDDFSGAKTIFSEILAEDESDIVANFGMSRYYGSNANPGKDKEMAMVHLKKAEAKFPYDNIKAQEKYKKHGVTVIGLEARRERIEKSILQDVKKANTVEAYDKFIARFPNSSAAESATNYRNKVAFAVAMGTNTVEALDAFITKYPDAYETQKATPNRNKMASEHALKANSVAEFESFISRYPDASQVPQMKQRLNAVAFENAKAASTSKAFEDYIAKYPDSIFLSQAKEKLDWLQSKGE